MRNKGLSESCHQQFQEQERGMCFCTQLWQGVHGEAVHVLGTLLPAGTHQSLVLLLFMNQLQIIQYRPWLLSACLPVILPSLPIRNVTWCLPCQPPSPGLRCASLSY